ncbi:acid phosphatase [Methylobacterium gnaphalii]|uniref:Acid phosphatase n=1 Tax=Methylobacterium gnaphalii TaxID=1010610 RepID=A0A512JI83_9HYPH|nr:phosphatase PAP2 family protein [Methylobacterium gnaphalii]GEP09668.1 acid phosphatase [Methylobacterium gnaphalii]GJD67746.1 Major phosphate-irrepressible acid phosphatase [Methylobacterium gnaphalii]GLS50086.1 acid phosphatase [Methylobacterium gnaphalii]
MPRLICLLTALLLSTSPLSAEPAAQTKEKPAPSLNADPVNPDKPAQTPYLTDETAPDTLAILPAPPGGHSAADAADRAVYNATRALVGTPRWEFATSDVAEGAAALLENLSCVLGRRLDARRVPTLITLLDRTRLDLVRAVRAPKRHYRRLRPFVGNDAPICVARDPHLADSFSYPSGHATQGWAYALIMASLLPEKATPLLVRGRLYGESRVVCGVHWMSDVVAGRTNASAVVAALMGHAGFRADLDKARTELKAALAGDAPAPDAAICRREEVATREPLP